MNTKPNIPEELDPLTKDYSFRTEIKTNGWAWVAIATSFAGEVVVLPYHRDWPVVLRAVIALVPLLAGLLWVRSAARWIRGMDELHRRITLAACLFATVATLFVVTAWHLLDKAGVFLALFPTKLKPGASWDLGGVWVIVWLVCCFYILGNKIFNRRYK